MVLNTFSRFLKECLSYQTLNFNEGAVDFISYSLTCDLIILFALADKIMALIALFIGV